MNITDIDRLYGTLESVTEICKDSFVKTATAIRKEFSKMKEFEVRVHDFNDVANNVDMMKTLRRLTLERFSGMNHELDHLEKNAKVRKVRAHVMTASINNEVIAWALLSKENSDFCFPNLDGYSSFDGTLMEIFVSGEHRRKGIGTEFMKIARRKSNDRLCIAPHDYGSRQFFGRFTNYNHKKL